MVDDDLQKGLKLDSLFFVLFLIQTRRELFYLTDALNKVGAINSISKCNIP